MPGIEISQPPRNGDITVACCRRRLPLPNACVSHTHTPRRGLCGSRRLLTQRNAPRRAALCLQRERTVYVPFRLPGFPRSSDPEDTMPLSTLLTPFLSSVRIALPGNGSRGEGNTRRRVYRTYEVNVQWERRYVTEGPCGDRKIAR